MNNHSKGLLAVIAGNVIFGFSFLFSRLALDIAVPSIVVAARFITAFAAMNLLVIFGRIIKKKDGSPLIEFSLKGKPVKTIILMSIVQPVLYFFCETYGILYTSSAFSGTIIAVIPIMGIVFDRVIMHGEIRRRQVICAVVSVIGVFVTTLGAEGMKSSVIGVLFLMGAVCFSALFYVFSKQSSAYYTAIERTYVMFAVGAVVFSGFATVQCGRECFAMMGAAVSEPVFIAAILYLAVVSSVVAFVCQNYGSGHVSVSEATLFANLTTVISILAGVIFLKEAFTLQQIIGAAAILVSVYAANVRGKSGTGAADAPSRPTQE